MRKYRKKEGVFMFNFMFNKDKPTKKPQERRYQTQEELERKLHMDNIAAIAKRRNVDMGVAYAMYNYGSIPCFTPDEERKAFEEYFAQFK